MQIVKEKLDIDEKLEKKINNLLKFNNIKAKLENGNIISLTNTNIAYIEPHTLEIKGITYLFFNECNKCKTYVREYKIVELLIDEITDIIEYDSIVKKHFAPLLKKKLENTNELLSKELYILKDKIIRLKDAYLNEIINLSEYKEDKMYLENRIIDVEKKIKEEQELE